MDQFLRRSLGEALQAIRDYYGSATDDRQVDQLIEEAGELVHELLKERRTRDAYQFDSDIFSQHPDPAKARERVVSEMSDAFFCLEILRLVIGVTEDEMNDRVKSCADRLVDRLTLGD